MEFAINKYRKWSLQDWHSSSIQNFRTVINRGDGLGVGMGHRVEGVMVSIIPGYFLLVLFLSED